MHDELIKRFGTIQVEGLTHKIDATREEIEAFIKKDKERTMINTMNKIEYEKIITKEPIFIRENLDGDTSEVTCLSPKFIGTIHLSETMLNKGIIDANASVKKLLALVDKDFKHIPKGKKERDLLKEPNLVECVFYNSQTTSSISLYRTKRGDCRFSICGIKQEASAGDVLGLTYGLSENNKIIIIVNVEKEN